MVCRDRHRSGSVWCHPEIAVLQLTDRYYENVRQNRSVGKIRLYVTSGRVLLSPGNCLEVTSAHDPEGVAGACRLFEQSADASRRLYLRGRPISGPADGDVEYICEDSQVTPRLPRADLPAAGSRNKRRCRGRT